MSTRLIAAALAGSLAFPALAQAQNLRIPVVRIPATVTGVWVLNPSQCPDIREDFRDARVDQGRKDRREDRRDQRVIDCPASAYSFVPNAGQAPNKRIKVNRNGQARFLEPGEPARGNGRGYGRAPVVIQQPTYVAPHPTYRAPTYVAPTTTYTQPSYQAPTYTQPTYQAPTTTYTQPSYQAPTYQAPTYQAPATTYTQPSYTQPTYNYTQPTYQ